MKEIDWSKAPELATHWCPETDDWFEGWYIVVEPLIAYFEDGARIVARAMDQEDREILLPILVPRPAPAARAWDGTGLPPVGTALEFRSMRGEWIPGAQIGQFNGQMVVGCKAPGAVGYCDSEQIRPVRTPEQIAAEEREKAIDEIAKILDGLWSSEREAAGLLYDAGYRRQEPSE